MQFQNDKPRRVFISGQKRGVFGVIKRELGRRSAIEPVIGHIKSDGHFGRCHLNALMRLLAAQAALKWAS